MENLIVLYPDSGCVGLDIIRHLRLKMEAFTDYVTMEVDQKTKILFVTSGLTTSTALRINDVIEDSHPKSVTIISGIISSNLKVDQIYSFSLGELNKLNSMLVNDHFLIALIRFLELSGLECQLNLLSTKRSSLDTVFSNKECNQLDPSLASTSSHPIFPFKSQIQQVFFDAHEMCGHGSKAGLAGLYA